MAASTPAAALRDETDAKCKSTSFFTQASQQAMMGKEGGIAASLVDAGAPANEYELGHVRVSFFLDDDRHRGKST